MLELPLGTDEEEQCINVVKNNRALFYKYF